MALKYPLNEFRLPPAPKINQTVRFPTTDDYLNLKRELERYTRDTQKSFELFQKSIDELQKIVVTLGA